MHSMKIRFLIFTLLKYLSCLLCYLGIIENQSLEKHTLKTTTIWQFPLTAGLFHSTTCNDFTYILIILEALVEMVAM